MIEESVQLDSSPYSIFILAIRSPITREKYLQRLGYFFDYVGTEQYDTIEDRCNIFGQRAKGDIKWLTNNILKYLQLHKDRVERKEITGFYSEKLYQAYKIILRTDGYQYSLG
jgi:hypothetical protein